MKFIKVLSLICFLTIGILAQQTATVSGTLTNAGKTIANQKIKLVSLTRTVETTTDSSGNYKFDNVANGSYLLVYGTQQASVNVENGQASIGELGQVVVISANSTQSLDEVSKSVNIIDAQELRDRADFSLVESLRTIPGFRVQQLGGFGRTASIKTRGLRNQDTAILIDGIRFRDVAAITGDASPFLSDFTLTSVDRIEVLRGSGSSLYGTNAIGGTIDFQTPKPAAGWHGQLGTAFGGYGLSRFRGNLSNGTEDGKFGFNVGASRTVYSDGIDQQDAAHNNNVQARIEYNPFSKTNISGRIFFSNADVQLNSSPNYIAAAVPSSVRTIVEAIPLSRSELRRYESGVPVAALNRGSANFIPDANDPDNEQKSRFFSGQIALTQIINPNLVFQGYYQGLKTRRRNINGPRGLGFQSTSTSFFEGSIQTANGHFNWTPTRTNEVTVGYEYEYESYDNNGFTPTAGSSFFARANQSSNTIYAQDLIKLFDNKLQLAGGVRAQFFDLKTPTFSRVNTLYSNLTVTDPPTAYTFDGAASYFFQSGTKIRAHVGNGYRVPSLYERFGSTFSSFSNSFTALGDPNLNPERTIAFDGGVEQNISGNRAKLSAVYFYTKLNRIIGFSGGAPAVGTTPRPFGGYFNTFGGIARGMEFSGQMKATSSTDVFASYTYTNSDQPVPQVSNTGIVSSLAIPKNQFTLVATQRFNRAWVNFDFLATSDYFAALGFPSYVFRFKGNRKADLTAGYTFPFDNEKVNVRLFGTLENLFDYDYYENGFRTFGRAGRIGLSFGF